MGYGSRCVVTRLKHTLRPDDGQRFHPSQFAYIGETMHILAGEERFEVVLRDAHVAGDGSAVDLEFHKGDIDALVLAIGKHPDLPVQILWPSPERSAAHPPTVTVGQWAIVIGIAVAMIGAFWAVASI